MDAGGQKRTWNEIAPHSTTAAGNVFGRRDPRSGAAERAKDCPNGSHIDRPTEITAIPAETLDRRTDEHWDAIKERQC